MEEAYIGLGSNIADPRAHVSLAIHDIAQLAHVQLIQASSLYSTKPWGGVARSDFINAVVKIHTDLAPQDLLQALLAIEHQHGRVRQLCWGDRTLDCDLLIYGNQIIQESHLCVPHPQMHTRNFVLVPLFEIAPHLVLPGGQPIAELLKQIDQEEIKKLC